MLAVASCWHIVIMEHPLTVYSVTQWNSAFYFQPRTAAGTKANPDATDDPVDGDSPTDVHPTRTAN